MHFPNTDRDDPLRFLRSSTPDSLRAARGFVIGIGMGCCMWAAAVLLYFWLIK